MYCVDICKALSITDSLLYNEVAVVNRKKVLRFQEHCIKSNIEINRKRIALNIFISYNIIS